MRGEDCLPLPAAKSVRPPSPQSAPPEVVDPIWILKAAGAVVVLGVFCAYLTLCLFFYAGQWQFVLHPSPTETPTPAAQHLPFTPIRFGPDASGQPQLFGWWLPGNSPASPTILMLHAETGSMPDALTAAKSLHDAGPNVLLFDYRGYGQSLGRHPSESLMHADAESALQYLTGTVHRQPGGLLVYGSGLGASLAVTLCSRHPEVGGLILEAADGDTLTRVEQDQRSRLIPIALLFHERFRLADPLSVLKTPKLLISYTRGAPPIVASRAASPKMTVELEFPKDTAALTAAVRRFLDTYVSGRVAPLSPSR